MSARDDLIERVAVQMYLDHAPPDHWWEGEEPEVQEYWRSRARSALSVIQTATSTCPECGGSRKHPHHEAPLGHPDSRRCERCDGQPGPLLVLEVLGGTQQDVLKRPLAGDIEVWRFLRRQEGK